MENPSPWSAPLSSLSRSPLLPFSPSPLPFAPGLLRFIMNAVRAQPLTRLAAISDRDPDQVTLRQLSASRGVHAWTCLFFLSPDAASRESAGPFLLHQSCPLTSQAVISRNRVPEARIDLSKLSLTNRSVVKQERPER